MQALRYLLRGAKISMLSHFASRRMHVLLRQAACSITFDDVPESALRNGVPLLEQLHVPGTFYVSCGLGKQDRCLSGEQIKELVRHGFEVGCHTYSHYRLYEGNSSGLAEDAAMNRRYLAEELEVGVPKDFAYPHGQVSFGAKKRLASHYQTMRSIYPGLNERGTDMLLLRANPIFSVSIDWPRIHRLATDAAERGAWLIFYTHGVEDQPDAWSCTVEDLKLVITICRQAGLCFRSVRSVSDEIQGIL